MKSIAEKLKEIQTEIEQFSPHPERVKLIAVSKYSTTEELLPYLEEGVYVLGENRVQVIQEKVADLEKRGKKFPIEWHFIGNLQKNKVKYIIDQVAMIHSINKLSLAEEIDKRAKTIGRKIPVLLEVNVSGEESKEGYSVEDLEQDLPKLLSLTSLSIQGLMTMAPFTENREEQRKVFQSLRALQEKWNQEFFAGALQELSMGMSNDYQVALEEGATMIRLGRKIFD